MPAPLVWLWKKVSWKGKPRFGKSSLRRQDSPAYEISGMKTFRKSFSPLKAPSGPCSAYSQARSSLRNGCSLPFDAANHHTKAALACSPSWFLRS